MTLAYFLSIPKNKAARHPGINPVVTARPSHFFF
ncbi:hypothetical protein BAC1_01772 [uncultured bacterium]|nr:hypothetical protein BAC1_01772 [uncultured bacterium]